MKRALVGLSVLSALAAAVPARAFYEEGRVDVGVNHPRVAQTVYQNAPMFNGLVGYAMSLRSDTGISDVRYTLTRRQGPTGLENPDVFFYTGTRTTWGGPCDIPTDIQENGSVETGTVCPGPKRAFWAVVVLRAGAFVRFSLAF